MALPNKHPLSELIKLDNSSFNESEWAEMRTEGIIKGLETFRIGNSLLYTAFLCSKPFDISHRMPLFGRYHIEDAIGMNPSLLELTNMRFSSETDTPIEVCGMYFFKPKRICVSSNSEMENFLAFIEKKE